MNSLFLKARVKFTILILLIIAFIYLTTNTFSKNITYQIIVYLTVVIYYASTNRDNLKSFIGFTKFLAIVILILHIIFFLVKGIGRGWDFAIDYYTGMWRLIFIRVFIIPNIFAFFNILISKVSIIDIMLLSKNSKKTKVIYILFVAGIEVMERLRIHYEHHPENSSKKWLDMVSHYLAVPLSLFFGIYRGFEHKHKLLLEREHILEEKT
ncbi:MAG: hypothetical protein OCD02_12165 [Spirochaetaceae bacterium]